MKYDESNIIELYNNGKNQHEIADLYGTYNTTIRRVLIRNGIIPRNQSEAQISVKENPFTKNTEESNYWLGYLIADGCVSVGKGGYRVIINTNKDPEHLKLYGNYINKPVRCYRNKKYGIDEYSVSFYNKAVVKELIELGVTPNKSLDIKLSIEFNKDILRGIFDGDGSVSVNRNITITSGSEMFIEQLGYFLKYNNINYYIVVDKRGNRCYNLYIKNKERFYELLYIDATIYLKRKEELLRGQLFGNK